MAITNLNTRIALKYDSYANWTSKNPQLLPGELAIAYLEAGDNRPASNGQPAIQNAPNILFKVGAKDAQGNLLRYNDLKFISGLAADVYSWAKVDSFENIPGINEYIVARDTNTTYQIVPVEGQTYTYNLQHKNINDQNWTTDYTINLNDVDVRLKALEEAFEGTGTGSIENMITEKLQDLDLTVPADASGKFVTSVSQLDGKVEAEYKAIETSDITDFATKFNQKQDNLEFEGTYDASTNKVATVSTVTNAIAEVNETIEALDSVKLDDAVGADITQVVAEVTQTDGKVSVQKVTLADMLPTVSKSAGAIVTSVEQVKGEVKVESAAIDEVLAFTIDSNGAGYNGESNPIATKSFVLDSVADLSGAMHFIGTSTTDPKGENGPTVAGVTSYKPGDVVLYGYDEYVYDGNEWLALGNESIYLTKGEADTRFTNLETTVKGYTDTEIGELHTTITGEIGQAISDELADLDYSGKEASDGKFVTDLTQVDGKITSVTYGSLAVEDIPENIPQSKIAGLETDIASKQDELGFLGNYDKDSNKVVTESHLTEQLQDLDYTVGVEANKAVTGFEIADGKLIEGSVTSINISAVGESGNVKDLIQTDLLIINCGSATKNITSSDAAALTLPQA